MRVWGVFQNIDNKRPTMLQICNILRGYISFAIYWILLASLKKSWEGVLFLTLLCASMYRPIRPNKTFSIQFCLSFFSSESFLRENPEQKFALFVRSESRWDDDVGSGREPEPHSDLPQVDEVLGSRDGFVVTEKVRRKRTRSAVRIADIVDSESCFQRNIRVQIQEFY